jgi:hypothetical protein
MSRTTRWQALRALAEKLGVCVRPVAIRYVDPVTGEAKILNVPCGARLASQCKPCANANRRVRVEQITEGWHLTEEPTVAARKPSAAVLGLIRLRASFELARDDAMRASQWAQVAEVDEAIVQVDEALSREHVRGTLSKAGSKGGQRSERRTRSTKRRQDVPNLPRLRVEKRTLGKVYKARDGHAHRPSMLVSLTLDSYGPVHTGGHHSYGSRRVKACGCGQVHDRRDALLGVPIDPDTYDYRAAALDAIHFGKVLDRWWDNLRRCAGWQVQYAGCVELQRRLAPHTHFAIRGTLPRTVLKKVAAATYHQVWWPHFNTMIFTPDHPPVWDAEKECYVDPADGQPLLGWDQCLDALDDTAGPAYVAKLGTIDARGISAGTDDAKRSVRYITKYLTKDVTDSAKPSSEAQREHFDRLHAQLAVLPCSPTCANWLLYGVQPDNAKPGLFPGRCKGKVHQRASLGFTGRRVLMSRKWSTRTMADIRGDKRAWVQAILAGHLDGHQQDQAADQARAQGREPPAVDPMDGPNRYRYEYAPPGSPGVEPLHVRIQQMIAVKLRWKAEMDAARAAMNVAAVAGAGPPQAAPDGPADGDGGRGRG